MFIIFRVLLTLIHLLYGSFLWGRRQWREWKLWCDELWHGKDSRLEAEVLISSIKGVGNLPKHLAVILGHEAVSFLDLVRIVSWCVIAGIPYVSFYDHNGFLRKSEEVLETKLAALKPELEEHIVWCSHPPVRPHKNGINGTKHKTKVQLLSYEDGKGKIVSLAQNLAKAVTNGDLQSNEINIELLDEKLHSEGIPDPDLAFICGHTFSTYGFLPWQIRTTEFFLIPSHHNLPVKNFVEVLKKYSKCEQRYGK